MGNQYNNKPRVIFDKNNSSTVFNGFVVNKFN